MHAVAPIFQVANLQRAIDFYTQVLGFELGWTCGRAAGPRQLCRDGVEITMESRCRARAPSKVYIQVNGIDEYFARVVGRGARSSRCRSPIGSTACATAASHDPDGNEINIGESLVKD